MKVIIRAISCYKRSVSTTCDRMCALGIGIILCAMVCALPVRAQHTLKIEQVKRLLAPNSPLLPAGSVLIDGVEASDFNPALWNENTLHWVPDVQYPLFSPKEGHARNIYSATTVEETWGWRIYYGGWDGVQTRNDRLYEAKTTDFISFTDRQMSVDHGEFKHISNASAQKLPDGSYDLLGTSEGLLGGAKDSAEKPALFRSTDGDFFNGGVAPYQAKVTDNLPLANYPNYESDHFNGANVLFRDTTTTRFIFHEWINDRNNVYWAEGKDPYHLTVGGKALQTINAPNDLRKFTVANKDWYVLALYRKADVGNWGARDTEHTWFSLSTDGRTFGPEQNLITAVGRPDRFIFSVNFVSRGNRLLGVTYGASENASVDKNSIYAAWLQKLALLIANPGYRNGNGGVYPADGALGPDRQRFTLPQNKSFDGTLVLFDDDGKTKLGSVAVHLEPGYEYRLTY